MRIIEVLDLVLISVTTFRWWHSRHNVASPCVKALRRDYWNPQGPNAGLSICCAPSKVYDFVSDARNLPQWSFFRSVTRSGDQWLADTPDGPVGLRFVAANEFGVLDHYVQLGSGVEIHVPMRVIPNGEGSEVLFRCFNCQTCRMKNSRKTPCRWSAIWPR